MSLLMDTTVCNEQSWQRQERTPPRPRKRVATFIPSLIPEAGVF